MDFNSVWVQQLMNVVASPLEVSPRGRKTYECFHSTVTFEMRKSVLVEPGRKLSYKYMAAEAYWILSGDNRVETIAPYNQHIAAFSDDGKVFFGAYGPPIMDQLAYVVQKLYDDRDTRQAGLTIWRQCPPPTKDVPCTVAMFFYIRKHKLHLSVYMRSSDVWLGLPYDAFAFSMVGHMVCAQFNDTSCKNRDKYQWDPITPGLVSITAGSSHFYDDNMQAAQEALIQSSTYYSPVTPEYYYSSPEALMHGLDILRCSKPGDPWRWWEKGAL